MRPEDVGSFLASLAERGLAGCNVTLPHKQAALAAADHREPVAVAMGAANTLWLDGGRLCATNTDAYGFMTHLALSAPGWDRRDAPVAVLGAGGAARAIVWGLLQAGVAEIRVFNRTRARAEDLARRFGLCVTAYDWSERERAAQRRRRAGQHHVARHGAWRAARHGRGRPAQRRGGRGHRLRAAGDRRCSRAPARRGLRVVDGLGMLLHQAVPGFEKWFGRKPEVTPDLRAILVANIEGR